MNEILTSFVEKFIVYFYEFPRKPLLTRENYLDFYNWINSNDVGLLLRFANGQDLNKFNVESKGLHAILSVLLDIIFASARVAFIKACIAINYKKFDYNTIPQDLNTLYLIPNINL